MAHKHIYSYSLSLLSQDEIYFRGWEIKVA